MTFRRTQKKGLTGETWFPPCYLEFLPPAPFRVDRLDLAFRGPRRLGRRHLLLRDLGEHLRDQELVEDLVDPGVREPGMADVGRVPLGDRGQDRVLARRLVLVGGGRLPNRLE